MHVYKENILSNNDTFPVEVFMKDNLIENLSAPAHYHECVEVLFFVLGSAIQQINEHIFRVNSGDIVVISPGQIHSTLVEDFEKAKVFVLKFMPHLIYSSHSFVDSKYLNLFFEGSQKDAYSVIKNIAHENSILYKLFMQILEVYNNKSLAYELVVKGYIYQIIGMLIKEGSIEIKNIEVNEKSYRRLLPVLEYINEFYMNEVDMEEMSRKCNMSYYYFSRVFKKNIGVSFKKFVDRVRIQQADILIANKDLDITSIAFDVGYKSIASFNRSYKKLKGITPSMMRKKINLSNM